jgi:hypothetical protein
LRENERCAADRRRRHRVSTDGGGILERWCACSPSVRGSTRLSGPLATGGLLAIVAASLCAIASVGTAARFARSRGWRWAAGPVLLLLASAAVIGAVVATDATAVSIWIGIAVTGITTGFVDLSGLIERRQQLQPVERLVARRIGRLHQLLLQIIEVLFDARCADARELPARLRGLSEAELDLNVPAHVFPPRSRQSFAQQLYAQLVSELDAIPALQASGVLSAELDTVDAALRGGSFVLFVRDALPLQARWPTRAVLAHNAADVLELVQSIMPVAARAAGRSWNYGDIWGAET